MTGDVIVIMTREEARRCVTRARRSAEDTWVALAELHDREGWRALGYKSFRACIATEFDYARQHAYALVDAGRLVRALREVSENLTLPRLTAGRAAAAGRRLAAGETVDAVVADLSSNGHAEPPVDAEIVDPEPELHPSSTPGGAVDEAASPTPTQALGQKGDDAISVPANADLASRSVSLPSEAPSPSGDARGRGGTVVAHAPVLASSTSPTEPSPVEPESSTCSTGASEGAPPDEHWAVAELRLVKDQLWEVTVARDAALLEAERLWKELKEARETIETLEQRLIATSAAGIAVMADPIPARSIVEEEPERFEPPADADRARHVRRLREHIAAMPEKKRAAYWKRHNIKDLDTWADSLTDAELATGLAQFEPEEGA